MRLFYKNVLKKLNQIFHIFVKINFNIKIDNSSLNFSL